MGKAKFGKRKPLEISRRETIESFKNGKLETRKTTTWSFAFTSRAGIAIALVAVVLITTDAPTYATEFLSLFLDKIETWTLRLEVGNGG